jgi:hypothetical protein
MQCKVLNERIIIPPDLNEKVGEVNVEYIKLFESR